MNFARRSNRWKSFEHSTPLGNATPKSGSWSWRRYSERHMLSISWQPPLQASHGCFVGRGICQRNEELAASLTQKTRELEMIASASEEVREPDRKSVV